MMLEGLNEVPWSELQDAYGPATDVPALIHLLASDSPDLCNAARERLFNRVNHQGSGYQATPFVTSYLFELIQNRAVLFRDRLIYHLVSIAVGLDVDLLPYDFNLRDYRKTFAARASKLSERVLRSSAMGPHIELKCYESVNSRISLLHPFLREDNQDLRVASAFALSWFPECTSSLSLLEMELEAMDSGETRLLANFMLSYSLLSYHSETQPRHELITPQLNHQVFLVRVAAAISIAKWRSSRDVLEILREASMSEELVNVYSEVPFNEGNLARYAEKVVSAVT